MDKIYLCIDLKSFYASVECVLRNLDPLNTNLVVADKSRTEKTICLAVSPSLKAYGIGGRCRLFELIEMVRKVNYNRKRDISYKKFNKKSYVDSDLKNDKYAELDYIVAPPRMSKYIEYSNKIYNIYLKFLSEEDIFVYSIDEVFCDITNYLKYYNMSPKQFATTIIRAVYDETGITATGGIGTNMFLAKVAMDVVAKKEEANEFGVRVAYLDEILYRKKLWSHMPITDIWRVGNGTKKTLEKYGMFTMGDVALMSETNEELLYKLFGINAELLIDHAWGYEPCTIKDVKLYKPTLKSLSKGQVLHCATDTVITRLIVKEMAEALSLELVRKKLITDSLVLTVGYDVDNLKNSYIMSKYNGEIKTDYLGRKIPKHAHGTASLSYKTSSTNLIVNEIMKLYDKIINPILLVRRIHIYAAKLAYEENINESCRYEQIDLFDNNVNNILDKEEEQKERDVQRVIIDLKEKYGKNSILKGMNLLEGATMIERNKQIGGHHE